MTTHSNRNNTDISFLISVYVSGRLTNRLNKLISVTVEAFFLIMTHYLPY